MFNRSKLFTAFFIMLTMVNGLNARDYSYSEEDIYPEKISKMFAVKIGHWDQNLTTNAFWGGIIECDFRLKPHVLALWGGTYIQSQFPMALYFFDIEQGISYAVDVRCRFEVGPPPTNWFPVGVIDIGYLFNNNDWFVGDMDNSTNSLLIGGDLRLPLKFLNNGVVELKGQKTILGDKFTRFSCGLRWFFNDHIGVIIHGDNFSREKSNKTYPYSAFVIGGVFK